MFLKTWAQTQTQSPSTHTLLLHPRPFFSEARFLNLCSASFCITSRDWALSLKQDLQNFENLTSKARLYTLTPTPQNSKPWALMLKVTLNHKYGISPLSFLGRAWGLGLYKEGDLEWRKDLGVSGAKKKIRSLAADQSKGYMALDWSAANLLVNFGIFPQFYSKQCQEEHPEKVHFWYYFLFVFNNSSVLLYQNVLKSREMLRMLKVRMLCTTEQNLFYWQPFPFLQKQKSNCRQRLPRRLCPVDILKNYRKRSKCRRQSGRMAIWLTHMHIYIYIWT